MPVEIVTGERPDLSNLRVFGCPAYVHIDASLREKLGDKAWKGTFVGYAFDSPAWLIYNPTTRHAIQSRNVVFDGSTRHGGTQYHLLKDPHFLKMMTTMTTTKLSPFLSRRRR